MDINSATMSKPNVVILLTDQWRLQALGYAGNAQVQTPNIDRLAGESLNFRHAISGYPVCSPWRASFLTGQYPLTHGIIINDVPMWRVDTATSSSDPVGLGDAFKQQGYNTAYIGKWHVNSHGRSNYIAPERRLGFDYFKALECSHNYNRSAYYANDDQTMRYWEGYDVFAQTEDARTYIRSQDADQPFLLVLSWGPPHDPYETAPQEYRDLYNPRDIKLRPNVPAGSAADAREWIAGYYAHCTAIDKSVGDMLRTLDECELREDTVVVFLSDHGDMLGSQGMQRKQKPYDESIRVPFLLRYPAKYGAAGRRIDRFLNAHDIMPTLLGVCDLPIPDSVDGRDYSLSMDEPAADDDGALLACFHPFGEWNRNRGGFEYRGVRTARYTYCRKLDGPWLMFDNETDPYQQKNLIGRPEIAKVQNELEDLLRRKLDEVGDEFLSGREYVDKWGYPLDETGTMPIEW